MKGLCNLSAIATLQGNESVYLQRKYGFSRIHSDGTDVIQDPQVDTVFILTRHDSHARFVIEALKAGKNVFVEKPLALDEAELEEIKELVCSRQPAVGLQPSPFTLHPSPFTFMLGFNRRFAPCTRTLIKTVPRELPKAISIRVNAGSVPPQHWVNDPEIGGGRIIGEACHFIDLAMHIAGSPVTGVYAAAVEDPHGLNNTLHISLDFANGSIATIAYYSNGNKKIPKEYIEVFCAGQVAIIDDFRGFYLNKAPNSPFSLLNSQFLAKQDKGHSTEVKAFFDSIRPGGPAPIPFEEIYLSSLATFKVIESINKSEKIKIDV